MNNAEKFKQLFGIYATELWAMPEEKFLEWLNTEALEKQEQDRWVPVTERLPEEDEDVLVTVHFLGLKQTHPNGWNDHIKPSFYVDIAKHYSGEWCSASDEYKVARSRHIVTAWRPLPEPCTEEES